MNIHTGIFFILGLILGSFYNVVGLRQPKKISFVSGRSACPNCKHTLWWYELIPVLSYVLQGGKCRQCKSKISVQYPLIELATGILFAFSFYKYGYSIELLIALSLMSMLMIIFVTDFNYMLIPNKVLLFFLPIFILLRIVHPLTPWWTSITGAVVIVAIISLIIIVSKGGMGGGDLKLFGILGIVLGLKNVLLSFFLACLVGMMIGLYLKGTKRLKSGEPMPFGPSIVIGSIIAYFYGEQLISWYFRLF